MNLNGKAPGVIFISISVLLSTASAEMNQKFSRGLRLLVEAPHVRVDRLATPKVVVLLPAGVQKQRSERVILMCVITGLRSKAVRITWKVNGATGLKKHASSPQVHREPGGTFSAVGLYTVLAHKWSRENMYRCEVTYKGPFYYDKVESSLCRPLEIA
ncbi:immunoglobulin lambda constant 6 [Pimephales promelas]|uniref:immunoglobulin lambda constant 6 n=1 Tax=Pimephales promelas TaxID=90988 RepID=UPI0019556257|nr:immunoglobulin lambda constant 6 [Pimephales promelas]KAG1960200.1 immunoglobulin lambda-1 light chain [Pimephales promelas]